MRGFYGRLQELLLRFRRPTFALIERPATTEGTAISGVAPVAGESLVEEQGQVVTGSAQADNTTVIVSHEEGATPSQHNVDMPLYHPRHKTLMTLFEGLAPIPNTESASPEEADFPLFASLPLELRLLVWQFVAWSERIVEIQYLKRRRNDQHGVFARPPALLHVCQEARQEAFRVYGLYLGSKELPRSLYPSLATDVLFFRVAQYSPAWRCLLTPNSPWREVLKLIKRVAFIYVGQSSLRFMKKMVCAFPNLEEVIIFWVGDAHMRPLDGRGVSYIERLIAEGDSLAFAPWKVTTKWKAAIDKEFYWSPFELKPPFLSVRQWRMRETGT